MSCPNCGSKNVYFHTTTSNTIPEYTCLDCGVIIRGSAIIIKARELEIAELKAQLNANCFDGSCSLQKENQSLRARIAELEGQVGRFRELLDYINTTNIYCPVCDKKNGEVHVSGCRFKQALSQTAQAGKEWAKMEAVMEAAKYYEDSRTKEDSDALLKAVQALAGGEDE